MKRADIKVGQKLMWNVTPEAPPICVTVSWVPGKGGRIVVKLLNGVIGFAKASYLGQPRKR